jgi:hypothetical protein
MSCIHTNYSLLTRIFTPLLYLLMIPPEKHVRDLVLLLFIREDFRAGVHGAARYTFLFKGFEGAEHTGDLARY